MSVELLGFNIDDFTFDEAVSQAKFLIDGQRVSQVITINPEMLQAAEKDSNFANIIKEADMVIPDGVGVELALKLNGKNVRRIPGIDFAKRLLEEAACNDIPVAIVGAKEDVVKKAVSNLQKEINCLNVVYFHDGYFTENEKIYSELKAKSPKLILVALGSPKQEEFIYNAKKVFVRQKFVRHSPSGTFRRILAIGEVLCRRQGRSPQRFYFCKRERIFKESAVWADRRY